MMYRIIPKHENKKVINPGTMKRVPKEGIVVSKVDTFWKRREKDGDIKVEKITTKKAPKTIKKEEENK